MGSSPMDELSRELRALAVAWPVTPPLADRAAARLADGAGAASGGGERRRRRPSGRGLGRRPAVAIAAVLALAIAGTLAASPDGRSAVLEWLGLRGARVERGEPAARPVPRRPLGADLGLGVRTSLAGARARAGFRLAVPTDPSLRAPDAVYESAGRVALVYGPRPGLPRTSASGAGLVVEQLRGGTGPLVEKVIGPDARAQRLRIDGARALLLTGEHGVAYETPEGFVVGEQRIAGSTLLVERGPVLVRLEGDLDAAEAVRIVRSLR